jgi:hypothetical protein
MKQYLIQCSQTATGRNTTWDDATFHLIAWQPLGEALKQHSIGQRTQISKYMNDLLPMLRRLQTFSNTSDGRCFACGQLWEDTNHVIRCPCDARSQARTAAFTALKQQLAKQHTPTIMATLLTDSMEHWIHRRRIAIPEWPLPHEPIMQDLTRAFNEQRNIGWDQFLRGRLAKSWADAIHTYYQLKRPGTAFTPDQWMRKTITALWTFSLTLWRHRNAELHGDTGILSKERTRKTTALHATQVYRDTIGSVLPSDSLLLHRQHISTILNWTKQHLDAYLAMAEVICAWNIEPG